MDYEPAPSLPEAMGWLLIGISLAALCVGFLGL
jgi:hypothetical protein